jgi:hypothetical protein
MIMMEDLKDKAVLLGWIAGLLIIILVIWSFSQNIQSYNILKAVNNVFINNDDSRRLISYIPVNTNKTEIMGYWYLFNNSQEMMFVFNYFQDGILIPLGAVVSPDGNVIEIIPLSAHAIQVFDDLPQRILQMYIKRIETIPMSNLQGNKI